MYTVQQIPPALALPVLHPPCQALSTGSLVRAQVGGAGVDQATITAPVHIADITQQTGDTCQPSIWHKQFQGHFETVHELKIGKII